MEINTDIITPPNFGLSPNQEDIGPIYAKVACLSESLISPWTNRVPTHEPWPRQLVVDTEHLNTSTDEYKRNVRHKNQHDHTVDAGKKLINRLDGDFEIHRGDYWRR